MIDCSQYEAMGVGLCSHSCYTGSGSGWWGRATFVTNFSLSPPAATAESSDIRAVTIPKRSHSFSPAAFKQLCAVIFAFRVPENCSVLKVDNAFVRKDEKKPKIDSPEHAVWRLGTAQKLLLGKVSPGVRKIGTLLLPPPGASLGLAAGGGGGGRQKRKKMVGSWKREREPPKGERRRRRKWRRMKRGRRRGSQAAMP